MAHVAAAVGWRVLSPSLQSKINLRMTLCGGQCFHWHPTPRHTFVGAVGQQVYELREVHCPAKVPQTTTTTMTEEKAKKTEAADAVVARNARATGGATDEVCCWIEYRKLWPLCSGETATLPPSRARGQLGKETPQTLAFPSSSSSSSLLAATRAETDDELLTRYLSLDVDLAALWLRWTDAPTTRQHPLVTYLMGYSQDTAAARSATRRRSALRRKCGHGGGVATAAYVPIRHIRQDVHSCLFSFLCSQNNNVTRISAMVDTLCRHYGNHLCDVELTTGAVRPPSTSSSAMKEGHARKMRGKQESAESDGGKGEEKGGASANAEWLRVHSFPSIQQLTAVSEESLRELGFGYRSKYVVEAVKSISAVSLPREKVSQLVRGLPPVLQKQHEVCVELPFYADLLAHHGDLDYQRAQLLRLSGVGRKVADCVLLFSLSHSNLVPVDTHMAQVAVEYLTGATTPSSLRVEKSPRKRRRSDDEAEKAAGSAVKEEHTSWQQELLLWGEKAKQLKAETARKAKNDKGCQKHSKTGRSKSLSSSSAAGAAAKDDGTKVLVPPLYERHHDAIQHGFTELFGSHAGWAHSILFYYRMHK